MTYRYRNPWPLPSPAEDSYECMRTSLHSSYLLYINIIKQRLLFYLVCMNAINSKTIKPYLYGLILENCKPSKGLQKNYFYLLRISIKA